MSDRIKELEAAIEKAIERINPVPGLRATAAYNILRAAIAEPEKGPTCPKCRFALLPVAVNGVTTFECGKCGYFQPDSAQRPKMPEPMNGYKAAEWRKPKAGESWFSEIGILHHGMAAGEVCHYNERWIAVKDEPASDPLDREIAREEYLNDSGRDEPVKLPVVEYFRATYVPTNFYKVENGTLVETIGTCRPKHIGESFSRNGVDLIEKAEYEAAKHPADAANVIEPLWNPQNDRQIAKINELVERNTALEKRLRELEGRKG